MGFLAVGHTQRFSDRTVHAGEPEGGIRELQLCPGPASDSQVGKPRSCSDFNILNNMRVYPQQGFPGGTNNKELAYQYRRHKRHGFNPWVRKIPLEEGGKPLQYSCLESPEDRGAWWATIQRVAKTWTRLR